MVSKWPGSAEKESSVVHTWSIRCSLKFAQAVIVVDCGLAVHWARLLIHPETWHLLVHPPLSKADYRRVKKWVPTNWPFFFYTKMIQDGSSSLSAVHFKPATEFLSEDRSRWLTLLREPRINLTTALVSHTNPDYKSAKQIACLHPWTLWHLHLIFHF